MGDISALQPKKTKHTIQNAVAPKPILELLGVENENILLRQILYSSSNPILITTREGLIEYVNPAWEKLTGYSSAEVIGKNPNFLQSGKTPRSIYTKLWKTLLADKSFTSEDIIDRRKNGKLYQIHSTFFPVRQNGNRYYVQISYDITAAKHIEDLRKEFLFAAAHELKTPITVLKLLTQSHLAKAQKHGNGIIKISELKLIDEELDRLTNLINDLLDTSRFETGKYVMNFKIVDLTKIVKKALKKINIYAKNHTVSLTNNTPTLVVADSIRIEQVLLNILSNAVKYSPNGGEIIVSFSKLKNKVITTITDTGMGIPKNKQKLIFDRYYQVKSKSNIGFGLGLYISKEIIKHHKGKMWVESIVGKGSTFYFSLPVYPM